MEPMLSHADYAVSHLAESVCFLLHTYKGNWGLCHWALNHWGTWALGHWGQGQDSGKRAVSGERARDRALQY